MEKDKLIGRTLSEAQADPECIKAWQTEVFSVKENLPDVECGSFLVYSPTEFPKNSRWLVAEYYEDVKGFYSEADEHFIKDVTHWCNLPNPPQ
jgi:hypothetical protein